jgi:hypothetical protein
MRQIIISPMNLAIVLLLATAASAENVQVTTRVSEGQRVALSVFASTAFILLCYAIYLHRELARVTVRRLFGGLTAPLLSQGEKQEEEQHRVEAVGVELT